MTNEHDVPKVTRQHAKLTSQIVCAALHFLLGFSRLCQAKEPKNACHHGESRWPMQNRPNDSRRQRHFTRIDYDSSFGDETEGEDLPELDAAEEEKLKNDESLKWDEDDDEDKEDKDEDDDEKEDDDEDDDEKSESKSDDEDEKPKRKAKKR